jgi:hypothetical protein
MAFPFLTYSFLRPAKEPQKLPFDIPTEFKQVLAEQANTRVCHGGESR